MNHTTNYDLNQWEASDRVTRADFNADNVKLDAAIKAASDAAASAQTAAGAAPKFAHGVYTGNGTYGVSNPTQITFPFTPKVVILLPTLARYQITEGTGGSAAFLEWGVSDRMFCYGTTSAHQCSVSYSGNTISWYNTTDPYYQLNGAGNELYYLALG